MEEVHGWRERRKDATEMEIRQVSRILMFSCFVVGCASADMGVSIGTCFSTHTRTLR